jgi:regulator of cell morphogenesis and NO signaling
MHTCGLTNGVPVELCPPLQRLQDEHAPLRSGMNGFRELAEAILQGDRDSELEAALTDLHQQVESFVNLLEPHSDMEEGILFPMMAKYIGRDTGPIAVMDYEHDQAKKNLRAFLQGAEAWKESKAAPTKELAEELARYAVEAQSILTDHFMKEENVLFPMAMQLLSDEEKRELDEKLV